jgi:hypothetical protein
LKGQRHGLETTHIETLLSSGKPINGARFQRISGENSTILGKSEIFSKKSQEKFDLYQPFYYLCKCFPAYPIWFNL